jgi:hypothetical protein
MTGQNFGGRVGARTSPALPIGIARRRSSAEAIARRRVER